jgi:hypothetical protein
MNYCERGSYTTVQDLELPTACFRLRVEFRPDVVATDFGGSDFSNSQFNTNTLGTLFHIEPRIYRLRGFPVSTTREKRNTLIRPAIMNA